MSTTNGPRFVHLWDGEGYGIPSSFWSGSSGAFENHQGEQFRMVRNSTDIVLYAKNGRSFRFDPSSHALTRIADLSGNNITLTYQNNQISTVTDTVGRTLLFCYANNLLARIDQVASGSCNNETLVRGIHFSYGSYFTVTDPAGRTTSYNYGTNDSNTYAWLISKITYPTNWYTTYSYSPTTVGSDSLTYRISAQTVAASQGSIVKQFQYSYNNAPSGQVTSSTVTAYNGTQLMGYNDYSYSFEGMSWNVSDASHHLLRGVEDIFGVGGEVTKEITLVVGPNGVQGYTNYYEYDLWGNQIYSRRVINTLTNQYHETFSDYNNNALSLGFYSFAETLSQANHTRTDNNWNITSGQWAVANGEYSLAGERGNQSLIEVPQGNAAVQMTVRWLSGQYFEGYIGFRYQTNGNHYEVYLSAYDNTLRFVKVTGGTYTRLQAATVTPSKNVHYVIRVESSGYTHTVYLNGTFEFQVTDQDSSMLTGRYLALGTYSATSPTNPEHIGFSNICVQPLSNTFSNSFFSTSPNSNIHGIVAGIAELQNGTGSAPIETYFSYYNWGGLNQTKQRYNSLGGTQWLTTTRTYDVYGNPKTLTDPKGNMTSYGYSFKYFSAYLTSLNQTVVPGGTLLSTRYGYNFTMGTMLNSTDPNGYTITYKYDILGRPARVTYQNGNFAAYTYNDASNYANTTNENGWLTQQKYDGLGRLLVTYRFLNGKPYSNETRTYDWQNHVISIKDPLGNKVTYQYDSMGRVTLVTKPDLNTTSITYNDLGSWVRTTDENGVGQCKISDRLGRLLSVVENATTICGGGIVSNYYYDEVGNLAKITSATVQSTTYSYDNLNRLTSTTYPDGTTEKYGYDTSDNLVQKTDKNNVQTNYSYDSINRLVSIAYHGTTTTIDQYTYDRNSNLLQLQSQNATITYTYDTRNRITSEAYSVNGGQVGGPVGGGGGGGSVAEGTLITLANRTSIPVQNLKVGMQLLSYNVTTSQYAVATITLLAVVVTHNMLEIHTQDPLPLRVDNATAQKLWVKQGDGTIGWLSVTLLRPGDYLYNALSQHWTLVTSIDKAPSGIHVMFDIYTTAPFNYIADGYLDPPKIPTGSFQTQSTPTPSGTSGFGYSFLYGYNGEVVSNLEYSDYLTVVWSYDGLGRVLNVTSGSGTYYARFTYFSNDAVRGIQYGNGLVSNYTYTKLGQTSTITLTSNYGTRQASQMFSLTYSYTKTGTVASVIGSSITVSSNKPVSINEQYKYDAFGRLINSTVTSNGITTYASFTYDPAGNRLWQGYKQGTGGWNVTNYIINQTNNELSWYQTLFTNNSNHYSYLPDGSLKAQNVTRSTGTTHWSYTWNVPGQLLKVANDTGAQGYYAYDGLGRRVEAKEAASLLFYSYTGTETLSDEFTSGAANDYIYANGLRIADASSYSNTVYYYHTDALGSTRLQTDVNGNIKFSDSYQPFGQDNGNPGGSETYKFTGKPYSAATGLYYDYQRWSDPTIGRFISADPLVGYLSDPQSLNPYVYTENLPTGFIDPSGMADCSINPLSWLGCASNGWNSLSPEEQQGLFLAGFVALTWATGGTDLLFIGGIFALGGVGLYADVTRAEGGTPTLAGALGAANLGFSLGTGVYAFGDLLDTGLSIGTLSAGERLAANRAAGLGFEADTAEMYGLTRNVGIGRTMLQGIETSARAIPDYLGDTFFGEAKFTQGTIYNTRQIRIMIEGSSLAGKDLTIFTRSETFIHPNVWDWAEKFGVVLRQVRVPI